MELHFGKRLLLNDGFGPDNAKATLQSYGDAALSFARHFIGNPGLVALKLLAIPSAHRTFYAFSCVSCMLDQHGPARPIFPFVVQFPRLAPSSQGCRPWRSIVDQAQRWIAALHVIARSVSDAAMAMTCASFFY